MSTFPAAFLPAARPANRAGRRPLARYQSSMVVPDALWLWQPLTNRVAMFPGTTCLWQDLAATMPADPGTLPTALTRRVDDRSGNGVNLVEVPSAAGLIPSVDATWQRLDNGTGIMFHDFGSNQNFPGIILIFAFRPKALGGSSNERVLTQVPTGVSNDFTTDVFVPCARVGATPVYSTFGTAFPSNITEVADRWTIWALSWDGATIRRKTWYTAWETSPLVLAASFYQVWVGARRNFGMGGGRFDVFSGFYANIEAYEFAPGADSFIDTRMAAIAAQLGI